MTVTDELERLEQLYAKGTLSQQEFQEAKAKVLHGETATGNAYSVVPTDQIHGMNTETWCMLMHLSQLLYFALGAGWLAPIVMWAMSKDNNYEADRHGVAILNWTLSLIIYFAISGILLFFVVGIFGFIMFGVLSVVFPIIGAVKATNGEFWEYPMSIRFIRYEEDLYDSHEHESYT